MDKSLRKLEQAIALLSEVSSDLEEMEKPKPPVLIPIFLSLPRPPQSSASPDDHDPDETDEGEDEEG